MAEPFNPLQVGDPNGDGNPLYAGSPTLADAWRFNANATQDWLDQQRAISAQRGLWNPETGLPTQAGLIDAAQQYGSGVMMGTTAPGDVPVPGIRAFHGSPHSFDRFDTANIGTGEGAQAYGHGLYMAGEEKVAQQYRDNLSPITFNGTPVDKLKAPPLVQDALGWMAGRPNGVPLNAEEAASLLEKTGKEREAYAGKMRGSAFADDKATALRQAQDHYDAADWLRQNGQGQLGVGGHMYEVNIAANPEHFLDWDKPLSEQSKHVQEALRKVTPGITREGMVPWSGTNYSPSAGDFYRNMMGSTPEQAAADLHAAGIPGIRYLDAGSRGRQASYQVHSPTAGMIEGPHGTEAQSLERLKLYQGDFPDAVVRRVEPEVSSNHVVFDADTIAILRKYGLAWLMAGAGGVAAASQAQAAPGAPPASTPWHSRWNDVLQRYGYSTIPTP